MNTYEQGLKEESRVINTLQKLYVNVQNSTKIEDTKQDIDVWVDGIPLSIKAQHTCLKTGNLAFELEVFDAKKNKKEKSWYFLGRARGYLFLVGRELFIMNKTHLNKYVEKYGWDKIRGLKDSTKREQGALGHRHLDAVCGLVNLETLLRLKIAKKIATV